MNQDLPLLFEVHDLRLQKPMPGGKSKILAQADLDILGHMRIVGIKIAEGRHGLVVHWPSLRDNKTGLRQNFAYPLGNRPSTEATKLLLAAYAEAQLGIKEPSTAA